MFLNANDMANLAGYYNLNLEEEEMNLARNYIRTKQQKESEKDESDRESITMLKFYQLLDGDMFPSLKKIVQVALTIPVTSCSCERSFSVLRRLKTWLRGRMGDDRLDDMAVLAIERSTYSSCTTCALVSAFLTKRPRR